MLPVSWNGLQLGKDCYRLAEPKRRLGSSVKAQKLRETPAYLIFTRTSYPKLQ